MSTKKTLRLPNFKGRACYLDFPALHESNFAAYFTRWQLFGPEKSVNVDFRGRKVDKKSVLDPKVDLTSKSRLRYNFYDLKWLDSHSFDGFKCVEATQNKSRKTIFDKPNYLLKSSLFNKIKVIKNRLSVSDFFDTAIDFQMKVLTVHIKVRQECVQYANREAAGRNIVCFAQ